MSLCARLSSIARIGALVAFSWLSLAAQAATQNYAIIGDAGKWNSNAKSVQDSIKRAGIKSLVMPGDNLYSGTYQDVWNRWNGFEFSVVAIGNHNDGYAKEVSFFKMPGEYYSKTFPGDIRFLVLNSDNTGTVNAQMQWLENELQKDSAMTFLMWHHPSYTVTSFHNWKEKTKFQTAARELIHRYSNKITAVLLGHDHIGAFYCADEIPLVISGAVWETRTPENKNYKAEDNTEVLAQWVYPANTPTWARLEIDTEKLQAVVSFIRAADDKVLFTSNLNELPKDNVCRSGFNSN